MKTFLYILLAFITPYFEQYPWGGICNTQWDVCSTPEGVLEVHAVFYESGRV